MATQEGVPQAVFLEGGLSKDGKLRTPKLGMLDYMLRGYDCEHSRDIVFVPVGVNYDRVLEDRTLVRALDPEARRRSRWFVIRTTAGFVSHNLWLMLRNRWFRFGYAAVCFGQPIGMRDYCRGRNQNYAQVPQAVRFAEIEQLAIHLMGAIERQIPVVPTPLIAASLLAAGGQGADELTLKASFYQRVEALRNSGKMVVVPTRTLEHTFETALDMLQRRRIVIEKNGRYRVSDDSRDVLAYYANSIQ
jgi:glycerol-3-phosphate O-acyltransferase